jgi:hypothetical protein
LGNPPALKQSFQVYREGRPSLAQAGYGKDRRELAYGPRAHKVAKSAHFPQPGEYNARARKMEADGYPVSDEWQRRSAHTRTSTSTGSKTTIRTSRECRIPSSWSSEAAAGRDRADLGDDASGRLKIGVAEPLKSY